MTNKKGKSISYNCNIELKKKLNKKKLKKKLNVLKRINVSLIIISINNQAKKLVQFNKNKRKEKEKVHFHIKALIKSAWFFI